MNSCQVVDEITAILFDCHYFDFCDYLSVLSKFCHNHLVGFELKASSGDYGQGT
jgi:hypothetical protein